MHDEKTLKQYDRWGVARPEHIPHSTPEEIRNNLVEAKARSWTLDGTTLIAQTDMGPYAQTIPPEYICLGKDEKGLPLLKKVV